MVIQIKASNSQGAHIEYWVIKQRSFKGIGRKNKEAVLARSSQLEARSLELGCKLIITWRLCKRLILNILYITDKSMHLGKKQALGLNPGIFFNVYYSNTDYNYL